MTTIYFYIKLIRKKTTQRSQWLTFASNLEAVVPSVKQKHKRLNAFHVNTETYLLTQEREIQMLNVL